MNGKQIILLICVIILSACQQSEVNHRKVDSFIFIDQNEDTFNSDYLSGKTWIASFVFTNCETVCPPMMSELAILQQRLKDANLEVEIVSFTVDPVIDAPDKIKQYIEQFTDDEENWHILTGYSQEVIETFAREHFQTIVQKPQNSQQVIHGTNFYVVNGDGHIISEYNYIEDTYIEAMINDIKSFEH